MLDVLSAVVVVQGPVSMPAAIVALHSA